MRWKAKILAAQEQVGRGRRRRSGRRLSQAAAARHSPRHVRLVAARRQGAEAAAMANKWMKRQSEGPDAAAVARAAGVSGAATSPTRKVGYRKVLELDPENTVALNNLAWMLTEDGIAKGLEYAEQAHRLAPFNPGVLDTLGVAVSKSGDAKRGVTLLRMASTLAPAQDDIRLHLAKALHRKPATRRGAQGTRPNWPSSTALRPFASRPTSSRVRSDGANAVRLPSKFKQRGRLRRARFLT